MANSIDLETVFLQLMDEAYKLESLTADMDALTQTIDFAGEATVKVMKLSTVGLGNYSRQNGYPKGDITAVWEAMTLACERGRQFTVDRMDNDESLGLVVGNLIRTWMREKVAPEIDAYRFAKYASAAGIQVVGAPTTLTKDTVLDAVDAASLALDEAEVPAEGRRLYVSSTVKKMIEAAVARQLANENTVDRRVQMLDGIRIIPVPQTRFFTQITLDPGTTTTTGGYSKTAETSKDINFILMHPTAVLQATKLNNVKYFAPEVNQQSDGHLWQYRLYHDAFVYDNHQLGIYLHKKA
jgi:hypothetical protein